jgi:hypothetical protein
MRCIVLKVVEVVEIVKVVKIVGTSNKRFVFYNLYNIIQLK